jgi:hypothetical protein
MKSEKQVAQHHSVDGLNATEYQYRGFQDAEAHAILAAEVLGLEVGGSLARRR